jgi:hypothetical protein
MGSEVIKMIDKVKTMLDDIEKEISLVEESLFLNVINSFNYKQFKVNTGEGSIIPVNEDSKETFKDAYINTIENAIFSCVKKLEEIYIKINIAHKILQTYDFDRNSQQIVGEITGTVYSLIEKVTSSIRRVRNSKNKFIAYV